MDNPPIELPEKQMVELEKRSQALAKGIAKTTSWDKIERQLIEKFNLAPNPPQS